MRKANMQIYWNSLRKIARWWVILVFFCNLIQQIGSTRNPATKE